MTRYRGYFIRFHPEVDGGIANAYSVRRKSQVHWFKTLDDAKTAIDGWRTK